MACPHVSAAIHAPATGLKGPLLKLGKVGGGVTSLQVRVLVQQSVPWHPGSGQIVVRWNAFGHASEKLCTRVETADHAGCELEIIGNWSCVSE